MCGFDFEVTAVASMLGHYDVYFVLQIETRGIHASFSRHILT
jgi:hypothetical protein